LEILCNKRVLYIAPRFFGYEEEIKNEFIRRGALVDMLPDRIFASTLMTGVTKLQPGLVSKSATRLYLKKLGEFNRASYDLIFIVNGQTLSTEFLSYLKKTFPQAKYLLYLWDSLENRKSVLNSLDCYDRVCSFDMIDVKKYSLVYRPLFFSSSFTRNAYDHEAEYDISFVGTAHTDRYKIVNRVSSELADNTRHLWYLHLQAKWVFWYYKLCNPYFKNAEMSEFNFSSLSKSEVGAIFNASKSILDIEHPQQNGLTMRTFETLGCEKKLVTTNKNVMDSDFYRSGNILVVDRESPKVEKEFLRRPYQSLPQALYERYALAGWMDEVLEF